MVKPASREGGWGESVRHGYGWKTHAYTRLCECSVRGPWYQYFRDEWRRHPGPRKAYKPDADWGSANSVCPNSASWRDWTVWSFKQACAQAAFDGLYCDVSRPPFCANRHHGCGYLDQDGNWQPEVQLLATRELHKRLWIMLHEDFEDKLISHDVSGHLFMVTQSFSDIICDGENFTGMLKDDYYELLPLDKFRAEFMGHQWGVPSAFLPEFLRAQLTKEGKELYESAAKLPQVRHLAGMIFLHDSMPSPAYSDLTPYHTIWATQNELGWGDEVEFLPYWGNGEYLKPMGENLVASIFRRGDRALVVLLDNTDEDAQARMGFDLQALKVTMTRLRDFETNETFAVDDGVATTPILHRNFRLLLTEG